MPNGKIGKRLKDSLIQQALKRKLTKTENEVANPLPVKSSVPDSLYDFSRHSGYRQMQILLKGAAQLNLSNPHFKVHDGISGATCSIDNKQLINFSSYNYLNLSGDPRVSQAAKDAIDKYGTSVSASRIVSGERPVHSQLEKAIANIYEVDAAIAMVSGHATNVSTIGYLFNPKDLILHDEFIHNSSLVGAQLAGARRLSFPHNNWHALDKLLSEHRHHYKRALIIIEGLYSMDGDYPELPKFIEIKRKHKAFLMVDEAHSFAVMGENGLGIREHFQVDGKSVDIWMGTLSKALAGCGGYIAGNTALIDNLKFFAPGFLYSVGMPVQVAAPALEAIKILKKEPQRVARLHERSQFFLREAKSAGINTGRSQGIAVIAAITGSSVSAARVSKQLFDEGINVQPILYPAVPEKNARLRFFISCEHTEQQINKTIRACKKYM